MVNLQTPPKAQKNDGKSFVFEKYIFSLMDSIQTSFHTGEHFRRYFQITRKKFGFYFTKYQNSCIMKKIACKLCLYAHPENRSGNGSQPAAVFTAGNSAACLHANDTCRTKSWNGDDLRQAAAGMSLMCRRIWVIPVPFPMSSQQWTIGWHRKKERRNWINLSFTVGIGSPAK